MKSHTNRLTISSDPTVGPSLAWQERNQAPAKWGTFAPTVHLNHGICRPFAHDHITQRPRRAWGGQMPAPSRYPSGAVTHTHARARWAPRPNSILPLSCAFSPFVTCPCLGMGRCWPGPAQARVTAAEAYAGAAATRPSRVGRGAGALVRQKKRRPWLGRGALQNFGGAEIQNRQIACWFRTSILEIV